MGLFDAAPQQGYLDPNDRQMMLLAMGLGLMGAQNGANPFQALGRGGLAGLQMAMQNAEQRRRDAYLQQQTHEAELRNKMLEQQMQGQTGLGNAIAAAYGSGIGAGAQPAPPPPPQFGMQDRGLGAMPPAVPATAPAAISSDPYTRLMAMAAILEQEAGKPGVDNATRVAIVAQAEKMREQALKYRDENQGFETVIVNGKPTIVQKRKFGAPEAMQGMEPKPDYKEVSTGAQKVFYDPVTGKFAGQGFNMQMSPGERASNAISWYNATKPQFNPESQAWLAPPVKGQAQPAIPQPGLAPLPQKVADIRKEYNSLDEVKNYRAAVPLVNSAATAPDTPAGDLDVIYAVGKALDPGSVVREGELNLVLKSATLQQQLGSYLAYFNEHGRLTPGRRADLGAMLANRVNELKAAHDAAAQPFIQQADALGLPKEQIFIKPPAMKTPRASAKPTTSGPAVGTILDGYIFKGGDPNDSRNWQKAR